MGSDGRKALIHADDEQFIAFLGQSINEKLSAKIISEDEMVGDILRLLMDLGRKANEYVTKENLERVKEFCLDYLEKDEIFQHKYLNGSIKEEERQHWIFDDIASYSWIFNWEDIIQDLINKEWYWLNLFRYEMYNKNLLIWSSIQKNDILKNRAIFVMNNSEQHKLDGAIAWERMK